MGYAVFPDIINGEDTWHERVEAKFARQQFPQDQHPCGAVTLKCLQKKYESAEEVVQDIEFLERDL